jgi:hypothetical protein
MKNPNIINKASYIILHCDSERVNNIMRVANIINILLTALASADLNREFARQSCDCGDCCCQAQAYTSGNIGGCPPCYYCSDLTCECAVNAING